MKNDWMKMNAVMLMLAMAFVLSGCGGNVAPDKSSMKSFAVDAVKLSASLVRLDRGYDSISSAIKGGGNYTDQELEQLYSVLSAVDQIREDVRAVTDTSGGVTQVLLQAATAEYLLDRATAAVNDARSVIKLRLMTYPPGTRHQILQYDADLKRVGSTLRAALSDPATTEITGALTDLLTVAGGVAVLAGGR